MTTESKKERIEITDTVQDVVLKLAGGNPGAIRVCVELLKDSESIDPDNILGGLGVLMSLDTLGIYESDIWLLYKDVCGERLAAMVAVLRGLQLGLVGQHAVKGAIAKANQGMRREATGGIDVMDIWRQVREQLPAFQSAGA